MEPITFVIDNCEIIENNIKANDQIDKHMKFIKNNVLKLYHERDPNYYCSPIKRMFYNDHFEYILKMNHGQELGGIGKLTFTVTSIWKLEDSFGPVVRFDSFEPIIDQGKAEFIDSDSDSISDIDLN